MGEVVNLFKNQKKPMTADQANNILSDRTKESVFDVLARVTLVKVMLDARQEGVKVPPEFKSEADLILNFSLRFEPKDLSWDHDGIRETLSFKGQPFAVHVPWSAVYRIGGIVWGDEVPPEVHFEINPVLLMNKTVAVEVTKNEEPKKKE